MMIYFHQYTDFLNFVLTVREEHIFNRNIMANIVVPLRLSVQKWTFINVCLVNLYWNLD